MKTRPASVTVVAWILIVMGVLSLITSTITINNPLARDLMSKSPIPVSVQFAMMYAGLLIMIVSGIAMFKGQNWARWLYVIWSVLGLVIGFATSPMKAAMIPGLILFLIIVFFLFRPMANAYFSAAESSDNAPSA